MADNTRIEWADATFNPWWGCTKISPACAHCYAANFARRFGVGWGNDATRRISSENVWAQPLRWQLKAARTGRKTRVFCGSMCDVFEDRPELNEHRDRLFKLIEWTPHLFWLLLTKRPQNIPKKRFSGLPNVGLGVTIESDAYAWRVLKLLEIPAALHFVSCEPLLAELDITQIVSENRPGVEVFNALSGVWARSHTNYPVLSGTGRNRLDWVITGGESGPGARPSHPDWFRSLRDQCAAAGVPFFMKQITEGGWKRPFEQWPVDLQIQQFPEACR